MKNEWYVYVRHNDTDDVEWEYWYDNKEDAYKCARAINEGDDEFWAGSPVYAQVKLVSTIDTVDDIEVTI